MNDVRNVSISGCPMVVYKKDCTKPCAMARPSSATARQSASPVLSVSAITTNQPSTGQLTISN